MSTTFNAHNSAQTPALLCKEAYDKAPCEGKACLNLLLKLSEEGSNTYDALLSRQRYIRSLERKICRLHDSLELSGLESPEKEAKHRPDDRTRASGTKSVFEIPCTPVFNGDERVAADYEASDEVERMTSKKPNIVYSARRKSIKRPTSPASPSKAAKKSKVSHVPVRVATPPAGSIFSGKPIVLEVQQVRRPGFSCSTLPRAVVDKLIAQVVNWDHRRPQWEDGDRLKEPKCVYTFTCRNKTQWRQENGKLDSDHACTVCQRSRRLCVAWLSPGLIRVLPRKNADTDKVHPSEPAYWFTE